MGHGHSKDTSDRKPPQAQPKPRADPRRHSALPSNLRRHNRTRAMADQISNAARPRAASTSTPASQTVLKDSVASRGRNLFCTLLYNRDEQAERKQADDRRSVARMGRGYRVPRAFIDRFEWGELVGSGAYSYVQKAVDKRTGQKVAIKCIRKDPLDQDLCDQIETEVELQCEVCAHDNIVSIVEFINTPSMYFIVMELLEGDLLRTIVNETRDGKYSEQKAASTIKGLASALNACHAKNIAHLDIKPDNVLFSDAGVLKLADFGMAAKVPVYRDVGTPLFVAPEILLEGECDTKADIFSLGVVSYILLCGFAPWVEARTLDDLSHAIKTNRWDFYSPFWDTISADAKALVSSMMDPNPRRRPTAQQVIDHPWIVGASSKPFNRKVPRRIISHARHEFVKRASKVQALVKVKRHEATAPPKAGSREAMSMASTAPLTKRARRLVAAQSAAANTSPEEAMLTPSSASSATRTAHLHSNSTPESLNTTPRIVTTSSRRRTKSSLKVSKASEEGKTESARRSARVSFSARVTDNEAKATVLHPADDAGAGSGAGGAGAGGVVRLTAGDRAAMAARREADRKKRAEADETRWDRLRESAAHRVAKFVQELDDAELDEFD